MYKVHLGVLHLLVRRSLLSVLAIVCIAPGCAAPPQPKAFVATHIVDERREGRLEEALTKSDIPARFQIVDIPRPKSEASKLAELDERLLGLPTMYENGDLEGCRRAAVADGTLDKLLARGERKLAARVLFWRVACLVLLDQVPEARREARLFATLGLEHPLGADRVSSEVLALLRKEEHAVSSSRPATLRLTLPTTGIRLVVDGRPTPCAAPCVLSVSPGRHVLAIEGDALVPLMRTVMVEPKGTALALKPQPAPPDLALEQWWDQYGIARDYDSTASVALIAHALRTKRLMVLTVENRGKVQQVRGVLAVDGRVKSRDERRAPLDQTNQTAVQLVRDMLVRAEVVEPAPSLTSRPMFWVVVAATAIAAAGVTAYVLFEPETRTNVGLRD